MIKILLKSCQSWWQRDPFSQSAATAYYSIFSLPGLLIIIMGVAAVFFDQEQIEREVMSYLRHMLGYAATDNIADIVHETQRRDRDFWALVVGAVTLLFGASGVFLQLQKSLNEIWGVTVRKRANWLQFLIHRASAFGIVIAIGFLLMVSLVITAVLGALGDWMAARVPVYWLYGVYILNFSTSYFITAFLFALIFKVLPDVHVRWGLAMTGGFISATLFIMGEYALNTYFHIVEPASTFGAAGSLILLMLWVFYSCMILLLGAEFTKICGQAEHVPVEPTAIARKI